MKITDFGLWFRTFLGKKWSTSIPMYGDFSIFYDGECLGHWYAYGPDLVLALDTRYIIKFGTYLPDRFLTLDDFEIVANPDYQETE
jgi:hypothetical protein